MTRRESFSMSWPMYARISTLLIRHRSDIGLWFVSRSGMSQNCLKLPRKPNHGIGGYHRTRLPNQRRKPCISRCVACDMPPQILVQDHLHGACTLRLRIEYSSLAVSCTAEGSHPRIVTHHLSHVYCTVVEFVPLGLAFL